MLDAKCPCGQKWSLPNDYRSGSARCRCGAKIYRPAETSIGEAPTRTAVIRKTIEHPLVKYAEKFVIFPALILVSAWLIVRFCSGGFLPTGEVWGWTLAIAGMGLLYLGPAILARATNHPQAAAIFALNLLLGWSLLGWAGALVWALIRPAEKK